MKQSKNVLIVLMVALGVLSTSLAQASQPNVTFPGGQKAFVEYLKENVYYPTSAREDAMEGAVIVSFLVNTDGSISEVTIVEGLCNSCDTAVMKAFSQMPNWEFVDPEKPKSPQRIRMKIRFQLN